MNDGGPAFPVHGADNPSGNGMSLRDWFAGQALAGILSCGVEPGTDWEIVTCAAYNAAEAMLRERARDILDVQLILAVSKEDNNDA